MNLKRFNQQTLFSNSISQAYVQQVRITAENGVAVMTPTLPTEIILSPVITGVVLKDNAKVAGADVYIMNAEGELVTQTVTLSNGFYYANNTENGIFIVAASNDEGDTQVSGTINVMVSRLRATNGNITVRNGYLTTGTITPVMSNVEVQIKDSTTEAVIATIKTNATGQYYVGGVLTESEYIAIASGFGRSISTIITTTDEVTEEEPLMLVVENPIVLNGGVLISGIVSNAEGNVAGAQIEVRNDAGTIIATASTNQQGCYNITGYAGGSCTITALTESQTGSTLLTMNANGTITAGSQNILMKDGVVATGKVLGTDGRALAGATVIIHQGETIIATANSDASGIFEATGVPIGEGYTVEISANSYYGGTVTTTEVIVDADGTCNPEAFRIDEGRTIIGRIKLENGLVPAGTTLQLAQEGVEVLTCEVAANGSYLLPNIAAGEYDMVITITESSSGTNAKKVAASGTLIVLEAGNEQFIITADAYTESGSENVKNTTFTAVQADLTIQNTANISGDNNDVAEWLTTIHLLDEYEKLEGIQNDNMIETLENLVVNYENIYSVEKQMLTSQEKHRYDELVAMLLTYHNNLFIEEQVDATQAGVAVTQSGLAAVGIRHITQQQIDEASNLETESGNTEIRFTLQGVDVTSDETTESLATDRLEVGTVAGTAYIGALFDIKVHSDIYDENGEAIPDSGQNIQELDDEITIEIEVPAYQKAEYYVVAHVHNGVATLIPVEIIYGRNGENDRIRFSTSRFSTYAILSSDTIISPSGSNNHYDHNNDTTQTEETVITPWHETLLNEEPAMMTNEIISMEDNEANDIISTEGNEANDIVTAADEGIAEEMTAEGSENAAITGQKDTAITGTENAEAANNTDNIRNEVNERNASQVTVIGTAEEKSGKSLSMLNIILLLGIIVMAFLSSAKPKLPIASYTALAVTMVTFVLSTGFDAFTFANLYSIVFGLGLIVSVFEYYVVIREEKKAEKEQ